MEISNIFGWNLFGIWSLRFGISCEAIFLRGAPDVQNS
jgi:hypothetical protein